MPPRVSPNDEPDKLDSEPKSTPSTTTVAEDPGQQVSPPQDDDALPAE